MHFRFAKLSTLAAMSDITLLYYCSSSSPSLDVARGRSVSYFARDVLEGRCRLDNFHAMLLSKVPAVFFTLLII
jgi:hypothetical protein